MRGNVDLTEDRKFRVNPDKKVSNRVWDSESRKPKYFSTTTSTNQVNGISMFSDDQLTLTSTASGQFDTTQGTGSFTSFSPTINVEGNTISLYDLVRGDRKEPFPWAPKTFYSWMLDAWSRKFEPILLGSKEDRKNKKRQLQFDKGEICEECKKPIKPWEHMGLCPKCEELFNIGNEVRHPGGWGLTSAFNRNCFEISMRDCAPIL